jgi:hypothetical protein
LKTKTKARRKVKAKRKKKTTMQINKEERRRWIENN